MNPLWHGLLGFTIGVLGFVSVIGNGMVIYIFSGQKVISYIPYLNVILKKSNNRFYLLVTENALKSLGCELGFL